MLPGAIRSDDVRPAGMGAAFAAATVARSGAAAREGGGAVLALATVLCLALDARSLGRVRPDAHDHLADVVAAQQRQERLRRIRDAVHDGLAHADAPLPYVAANLRAERGLAVCMVPVMTN